MVLGQTIGEKTTLPPHWLINACHARGWTYATPSYRLLPEATGLDIVSDAVDAYRWVCENVSDCAIVAGSSAGGYLALATAANASVPRPLGVLSIYGMLDPLSKRYTTPGKPLRAPVVDLVSTLDKVKRAEESGNPIDGYPFPSDLMTDQRFEYVRAIHEAALYPDLLTRIPGLAKLVATEGVEVVPDCYKPLFPVSFGLRSNFPPTILLHGDSDELVDYEQSSSLADRMISLGLDVHLERAEGFGHGFDAKSYVDLDSGQDEDSAINKCLRRVVLALENFC